MENRTQGGEAMTHPIDALEALVVQGRIRSWQVERKPMSYAVEVEYLEYDKDSPKGVSNSEYGYAPTLSEAVRQVVARVPQVVAP